MGKKKTEGRGPYKMQVVKLRGPDDNNLEWAKVALTHLASSDIYSERIKQWKKWSYDHDDKHTAEDWAHLINERIYLLNSDVSKKKAHKMLVEIGALVLAALEAEMRRTANKPVKRGPRVQVVRK